MGETASACEEERKLLTRWSVRLFCCTVSRGNGRREGRKEQKTMATLARPQDERKKKNKKIKNKTTVCGLEGRQSKTGRQTDRRVGVDLFFLILLTFSLHSFNPFSHLVPVGKCLFLFSFTLQLELRYDVDQALRDS